MSGESTFTQTGVAETLKAIDQLPEAVTAALKGVALDIGGKVQATARRLLLEKTRSDKTPNTEATRTAAAIEVVLDEQNKTVRVISKNVSRDPANNPIWLEHGTVHQQPKAYMRPAADEHKDEYRRACEEAAGDAAQKTLGTP